MYHFLLSSILARNALLVLICAGIAAILLSRDIDALTLTHEVKPGLPPFALPNFTYSYFNNDTNQTIHKDFLDIVQVLFTSKRLHFVVVDTNYIKYVTF